MLTSIANRGSALRPASRSLLPIAAVAWLLLSVVPLSAQSDSSASHPASGTAPPGATAAAGKSYELDVPATSVWVDTNIDLLAGAEIQLTATGSATYTSTDSKGQTKTQTFGPAGLARGFRDLIHQYPAANAGHGALIGRVGSGDGAEIFTVGESQKSDLPVPGRLFLGINQGSRDAAIATGSFHVTIAVLKAGTGAAGAAFLPDTPVAGATAELLAKIPRRVSDQAGNPGD